MQSLIFAWRLFSRRAAASWPMLLVLGLGIGAAGTLLAAAPIYARTMSDLGLVYLIRDRLSDRPSTSIEFRGLPLATDDAAAMRTAVEGRIDERVGWFRASTSRYLVAGEFGITDGKSPTTRTTPQGRLQSFTGYETHVTVTEGKLPAVTKPGGRDEGAIQVAMSRRAAQAAALKVGQFFVLNDDFDTCERELPRDDQPPPPCQPTGSFRHAFPAVLVGIVEPAAPNDPFWVRGASAYFEPVRRSPDAGPDLPMFATESALIDGLGKAHPGYRVDLSWYAFADPARLSLSNFGRARDDISGLGADVQPLGGFAFSPMKTALDAFGRSQSYEQVPLTILLLEIAGVALFYVVFMAAILVDRESGEIALLRSRGASVAQVCTIYLLEGLLLGIPVVLAAPFLAAAATALLGLTPTFDGLSETRLLPVEILPLSFAYAAGGVALSLLALVLPAFVVARRTETVQRRTESRPQLSIIHRYYLDLALVGVAALLLWELQERGSVFTPSATGGVTSDPLLLASPAMLIAAAAALLLRFYPMLLRVGARLITPAAGPAVAMGIWQVVRRPAHHTRLALLLMMAVSVGTFAASYSSTTSKSYHDRAFYQSGVDFTAYSQGSATLGTEGPAADASLARYEGVERSSAVMRGRAVPGTPGASSTQIQVLAIDPVAARQMLWYRDDFSERPLEAMLQDLGAPSVARGKPIPDAATEIRAWLNPAVVREDTTAWLRVRDAKQQYHLLELGKLDTKGWREYSTLLDRVSARPLTLISVVFTEPANRIAPPNTAVGLDDITAVTATGQSTVIENFEAASRWAAFPARASTQDEFSVSTDQPHSGRSAGKLAFRNSAGDGGRGIYLQDENTPLPVLASESFVGATGIGRGGTGLIDVGGMIVPIVVEDVFKLFPTLRTNQGPALVFHREHLTSWLNSFLSDSTGRLNEAWFTLKPGADRQKLTQDLFDSDFGLTSVSDRQGDLRTVQKDPLVAAGGSGILLLAFAAILLLVGVATAVSLWTSVQRRRVEFAVLRVLGLSRLQLLGIFLLEYGLIAAAGFFAGGYVGVLVGQRMLSFLDVTEAGAKVEPPFILVTEWATVAGGAVLLLLAFGVALAIAMVVLGRSSDAQSLRTE